MTNDWAAQIRLSDRTEISYEPVNVVELEASYKILNRYKERFNEAITVNEKAALEQLINSTQAKINDMERRLLQSY